MLRGGEGGWEVMEWLGELCVTLVKNAHGWLLKFYCPKAGVGTSLRDTRVNGLGSNLTIACQRDCVAF